jgi:hypothetical protein
MAYPSGRLLALRAGLYYVLAVDGWTRLGRGRPAGSDWLTRAEAKPWCVEAGLDLRLLDEVPAD